MHFHGRLNGSGFNANSFRVQIRIGFSRRVAKLRRMAAWTQVYDPLGNLALSSLVAAIPALLLLVLIAVFNVKIHRAALIALAACLLVAIAVYHMPFGLAAASALDGACYGLFPIGWLVLNIIFFYRLTLQQGHFDTMRRSLAQVAPDPRIQVILIAYAFGAFLEGMSGFGAPVAITAAILIQLGFRPLPASGLALVANTAPVAFGSLGIPLTTLQGIVDLDLHALSTTTAGLLAPFALAIPSLIVVMLSGWRGLVGVWPAALVAGLAYSIPQYLVAYLHGPWLAAPIASICCIVALVALLRVWRPRELLRFDDEGRLVPASRPPSLAGETPKAIFLAWLPWGILTLLILVWGLPKFQHAADGLYGPQVNFPGLDGFVHRAAPIATGSGAMTAPYKFNILSVPGTGILIGCSFRSWLRLYGATLWSIRLSLLTMAAMLALGKVTMYSGTDGTLGLALARSGALYPFFGTLLGWIGAAITGSDTSSNVLFGSLQKITSQQLGLNPVLMGAANTCGGVMGKMVSSQSIVVASTATNWYGHEGRILRYVFLTSIALASLMGALVWLAANCPPFTLLVGK
jgi:lactate permease